MQSAMMHTLVHSRKVTIVSNQPLAVEKRGHLLPPQTGILAVFALTGINDGTDSDLSRRHAEVLHIQVASIDYIDRGDVSFGISPGKAPITVYSAQYTIEQIFADLKVLDDISAHQVSATIGKAPTSASSSLNEKVDYLLSLLKSAPSTQDHEPGCFLGLELIYMDPNATPSRMQISVKERLRNGIVRILWSTMLSCINEANNANCGLKSIDTLFQLGLDLSDQYEQVLRKLDLLKEQYQLLEQDRDGWKDTAQKLEGQWEDEKSLLFHNFCTLYAGKKEYDDRHVAELKMEITKLQQQVTKSSTSGTTSTSTSAGRKTVLPDCLQNIPNDDHHRLPYDDEMVRRLANGERVPMVPVKTEDSAAIDTYTAIGRQSKKRRNPVSGAIEYQDANEALQDILQSSSDHKKHKGNLLSTQERRPNVLEVASAAAAQTRVKELPSPTAERGSDSETGSDSDFIDKDIQAQILADLKALRKI